MHMHMRGRGCGPRGGRRENNENGGEGRGNNDTGEGRGRDFGMRFGPEGFRFEFGGPRGSGRHDGGGGWGGDDRPRGRRRMFGSGELRLVLLKLIADEPRHGYDLIRAIEERTGGQYAPSPGVVYPTLTMLTDMGLIEEHAAEGSRKAFAATDEGRKQLDESAAEVEALFARLDEAKPREAPHGGANIRRAMGNLMSALRNRVAHEGFDEALVHEVTAILDEAAQRIERLK
jgi:DNA-binding PadR family transcriptional regulator